MVQVQTTKAPLSETGRELPVPPGVTIVIEVGPRDPRRLQRICANLEREALVSSAYSSAVAADTLAHIKVAIPYLGGLLPQHDRFGPRAVDVLIPFVNDKSEDRRVPVRAALARIAARTGDLAIRQKIADSLR